MIVLITSHVQIHCCISFDLMDWFSCLYIILIVFEHDVCITIHLDYHILCVDMVIYLYFAWLCVAWLPSFCMIACRLFVWIAHLSPYLQLSWFRSFPSFRFSLLQVWGFLCACTLTEPEIKSRVYRRAIPMFGNILEVPGTQMSIRVRSLKAHIARS